MESKTNRHTVAPVEARWGPITCNGCGAQPEFQLEVGNDRQTTVVILCRACLVDLVQQADTLLILRGGNRGQI